jgi:hypothetical protein
MSDAHNHLALLRTMLGAATWRTKERRIETRPRGIVAAAHEASLRTWGAVNDTRGAAR